MSPRDEEAARLLRLAGRDRAAFAALAVAPSVSLPVALFHAQQAVEKALKALKAVMCVNGIAYRRTHDLEDLASGLAGRGLPASDFDLRRLTPYAVEFRYDDDPAHLLTAAEAERIVSDALAWAAARISSATQQ